MNKSSHSFLPISIVMLILTGTLLACSLFTRGCTPTLSPTLPPPPTSTLPVPTHEPPPTFEIVPSFEPPPPVEQALQFFTEQFLGDLTSWHYEVFNGDEYYFSQYIENGRLVMDLDEENLYVYNFYDPYTYEDVGLEVEVINMGHSSNNINLICRYSSSGWYEFTVQSDGLYSIWAYDDIGGSNYNMLWSGGSMDINTGQASNTLSIFCDGNRLGLYINGHETKLITDSQYFLPAGQVGFGVNVSPSNPVIPVVVGFESITIGEP